MTTTPDPRPAVLRPVPTPAETDRAAEAFNLAPRLRAVLADYYAATRQSAEPIDWPSLSGQLAGALSVALDQLDGARALALALFAPVPSPASPAGA